MAEIESSGSVDFTNPNTPDSGVLYDAAQEQAKQERIAENRAKAYEQAKVRNSINDILTQREAFAQSWAEATAKDERVHNNRHTQPAQTSRRSWQGWRQRQDWQRTVRGIHRQVTTRHIGYPDTTPPARGSWRDEGFFSSFFRMLGLVS